MKGCPVAALPTRRCAACSIAPLSLARARPLSLVLSPFLPPSLCRSLFVCVCVSVPASGVLWVAWCGSFHAAAAACACADWVTCYTSRAIWSVDPTVFNPQYSLQVRLDSIHTALSQLAAQTGVYLTNPPVVQVDESVFDEVRFSCFLVFRSLVLLYSGVGFSLAFFLVLFRFPSFLLSGACANTLSCTAETCIRPYESPYSLARRGARATRAVL